MSGTNKYPVKSVAKTLSILELLGGAEGGSTLTEISTSLRIGKSTVHRLLATLRDHDFVWLDPQSSRYILGARILQLTGQLSRQSLLIRYGESALSRLAAKTGETCNLGVLDGREVLYLIIKESKKPLRMTGQVGKRLPAHCTALGKAILSGLSREEFNLLYGGTQKLQTPTPASVSTVSQLVDELEKVRQTDIAVDNEELYPGVVCISAPIRNHSGKTIAAVSISLPKNRVDPKRLRRFKSLLLDVAKGLSRDLRHHSAAMQEVPS